MKANGKANGDAAGIAATLQNYESALKASDTDAILDLYTSDGVFMAPNNSSAVGLEAVRAAYDGVFKAVAFDVELDVQEIVVMSQDWAFVRTKSDGFVTVHANGARPPESNHELFIFHRDGSSPWKIARYSFASTRPPA